MTDAMAEMVEFLRERFDADELVATRCHVLLCLATDYDAEDRPCTCGLPRQLVRQVEARRRIIEAYTAVEEAEGVIRLGDWTSCSDSCALELMERIIGLLALAYRDHPDYDPAWQAHGAQVR